MNTSVAAFAIDGGSTKTHLAGIDSDGRPIVFGESGSTNAYGTPDITKSLVELLAPIKRVSVKLAVFTMSGWDFEEDQRKMRRQIEAALAHCRITVGTAIFENDIFAVYHSGIGSSPSAVALASGSGTIGIAVSGTRVFRTTGFGYISGEWGAGWEMADYAIHLVCSSLLGREERYPVLIEKAFQYFGAASLDQLVQNIIREPHNESRRGYFLNEVYAAYQLGCPGGKKVLEKGGVELAKTISALLEKLPENDVPVILGGGVFKSMGLLPGMKEHVKELTGADQEFRIVQSDPVWGGLYWAAKEGGMNTADIMTRIRIQQA